MDNAPADCRKALRTGAAGRGAEDSGGAMGDHKKGGFAAKHEAGSTADPALRKAIETRATDGELPCAVAFDIAERVRVSPAEVGKTADLMNCRLVKCQLGLFGYDGGKKIVKPRAAEDPLLIAAIESDLVDGRLDCRRAWDIAARFNLTKLNLGGVCEAMNVRIKPCQLGAF